MKTQKIDHPDYPNEYITGKVTFFGREFIITPDVLIPRLETEWLIRRARNRIRSQNVKTIVDIGTGSGIIWVSCADLVDEVIFLDISESALSITRVNFRTHFPEKKAQFIVSDLLRWLFLQRFSNTIFLANLPYIKGKDWKNMSADTHFEPEIALFGWKETGFEMYERLFEQLTHISPSFLGEGQGMRLIIEFGFDQRKIAEKVIREYNWKYEFFADYSGIERFCEIYID